MTGNQILNERNYMTGFETVPLYCFLLLDHLNFLYWNTSCYFFFV